MRKIIILNGFKINIDISPREKVINYVAKNKYIIPKIAEKEGGLAASTASALLKRLTEEGLLKDIGWTRVKYGDITHRCHLYTKP